MISDYIDMDTQQKIRYISESSNASTSGYSTMSPGPIGMQFGGSNNSPTASVYSMPPSPAQSPATAALQTEFSNLNLPSSQQHQLFSTTGIANGIIFNQQQQTNFMPLQPQNAMNYPGGDGMGTTGGTPYINYDVMTGATTVTTPSTVSQQQYAQNMHFTQLTTLTTTMQHQHQQHQQQQQQRSSQIKQEFTAHLNIFEHPVEKFRFRYKSEMHGTHGSLNGTNSKRTPKTFPTVELCNYNGHAVIRCSLFQTNLDSPHSHQLVVRKEDTDITDPHDLHVSPERGYIAQFQNMGIIHTAKKFIFDELLKKKKNRLLFETGAEELSSKQKHELQKETEKEAKEMNLNQVRLCFEAFHVDAHNIWTPIAKPVYTNPINNRKSAQTGELRICRLSMASGSVVGGDDLILLVEKVSKKNIKVRFYEMNEDEEIVWEAFAKFRESDVHHQYAITCQTPSYRNKDVDKPVEVLIELVRPSDDERSYPPSPFRYKPRDAIASRKRRRTNSSATNSSGNNSGGSLSSFELPKTVQEQVANTLLPINQHQQQQQQMQQSHVADMMPGFSGATHGVVGRAPTISEEFNKDHELQKLIDSECFRDYVNTNSEDLAKLCPNYSDFLEHFQSNSSGRLETDGVVTTTKVAHKPLENKKQHLLKAFTSAIPNKNDEMLKVFKIYDDIRAQEHVSDAEQESAIKQITDIICEQGDKSDNGDTIIHEIIYNDNRKACIRICQIIGYFKLYQLLNNALNLKNENGLHYACLYNHSHYIRPLLGLGCDAHLQDCHGNTALHVAVNEQNVNCVQSFLNMNNLRLNMNIKNDEGLTPLHLAIRHNNNAIVEKLLKHDRTAVLVKNVKDGNNALQMAVLQQNLPLVQLMLVEQNIGNILMLRNTAAQTSIDLALQLGTDKGREIYDFLMQLQGNVDFKLLTIKEEEPSSASTTDAEDEELDEKITKTIKQIKQQPVDEEEKEEQYKCNEKKTDTQNDDDDDDDEGDERKAEKAVDDATVKTTTTTTTNGKKIILAQKLENETNIKKLALHLNTPTKRNVFAQKLNLQHLVCLWRNADDMLAYLKKNIDAMDHELFFEALKDLDADAYETFKNI